MAETTAAARMNRLQRRLRRFLDRKGIDVEPRWEAARDGVVFRCGQVPIEEFSTAELQTYSDGELLARILDGCRHYMSLYPPQTV
jgi:hypothetical protein